MVFLKYNWPSIELEFVKGVDKDGKLYFPTKKELAELHDCDVHYLRDWARKEKWDEKRKAYLLTLEMKDGEIEIEDVKAELERFNKKCYQVATNALDIIRRQLLNHTKTPDLKELETIIKLLEKVQLVGKNSFTDMKDDYEEAASEFQKLMKKLKEDEKVEKEPQVVIEPTCSP